MALDTEQARQCLQNFDFPKLFIDVLGWSRPHIREAVGFVCTDATFTRREIAELAGVVVFEITAGNGTIPDADTCKSVHKEISSLFHENLLIFLNAERTQSLWYWVKREGNKLSPRRHYYFTGQPGDLFLSKISAMVVDFADLDAGGGIGVAQVAKRLQDALDVEATTKKFFKDFQDEHVRFLALIQGIADERDRHWYASVLLNRLMFIYFLQRKGFVDNDNQHYLQDKLALYGPTDEGRYYAEFLKTLFFQGFAVPADKRSASVKALLGDIVYLNGGLFLEHQIEERCPDIAIPDAAFRNLFALFTKYSWNLNDTPGGDDNEINPDVLGYIFEKYINQKAFGAYYTRPEITEYLCEQTIHKLILDKINVPALPGVAPARQYDSIAELLLHLDAPLCRQLLLPNGILPRLSLLDPACGSGAFLVAAMKTLINIYSAVVGRAKFLHDTTLKAWLAEAEAGGRSIGYAIKKRIITHNLFGVDVMEESTEIAKLRLFLALVSSAQTVQQLEPLPNIDFNILPGNSLIGLLRVTDRQFEEHQPSLFRKSYRELLAEKNRMIDAYRSTSSYMEDLRKQRDDIEEKKREAQATLNDILLDEFKGIKYEEATWDEAKNAPGKVVKRAVTIEDIEALRPFHWGYEFDEVLNNRGGFDAIITNPPWEIFKPNAKEFFAAYSDLILKKKMAIEDFEKHQATLLKQPELRDAWLEYQNGFPYVSAYYRSAKQYENQISVVNGKKAGTDINLYKLFTEQCFNLLRNGGLCGIIIPSGIYTDLGTKQLREALFSHTSVTTLYGLSNEKYIFEGVHHGFKFCLLVFDKGEHTNNFTAAFRINTREAISSKELYNFLNAQSQHLKLSVPLIRRLAPDSLSVMEFKNETDVQIAEKMLCFPLLGERVADKWSLSLTREFDMTNDSKLFRTSSGPGRLPLFEGKMIHQFNTGFSQARYWVDEQEGRKALLSKRDDSEQIMNYQGYRIGFRDVAASTNERTMIATVLPPKLFTGNTLITSTQPLDNRQLLAIVAMLNSFAVDAVIRQKVTSHCNMFYVYQLPIPRLTKCDPAFAPIVERAARLICTTPEFDDLAAEVGLSPLGGPLTPNNGGTGKGNLTPPLLGAGGPPIATAPTYGATDPTERARLRAELDGIIAHLYGLTEDEFAHILQTFPLVPTAVKVAAQNAYRDVARGLLP